MHIIIFSMTTHNVFNSQESDVSLLIATAGIKFYQKKEQVIAIDHIVTHTHTKSMKLKGYP